MITIPGSCIYKTLQQNVNTHPHGDNTIPRRDLRHVFTKSFRNRFVNTAAAGAIGIALAMISCKAPEKIEKETEQTRTEQQSTQQEKSRVDDTTTIRHKVINDSVLETKIIRNIVTQNEKAAQSLQNETREASRETHDTLTPAIVKLLLKGIVFACIGYAVLMAGVFFMILFLVLRLKK